MIFGGFGGYLIYLAILLIIPIWAQWKVKSTYKKYSKVRNESNMTGAEVARKILDENGLYNVAVEEVKGMLSDHYDPRKKVVRLSSGNYHEPSAAAQAVAAHEVGHAIQDAEEYAFLKFRSSLAPVASIGSNMSIFILIAGVLFSISGLVLIGIVFMAFAVLFQFVTLPVEFDASNRAMNHLISSGVIRNNEEKQTKKVLNAAALTYVASALVALLELLRFVLIFVGMNED
ncbi:Zn-dependent protease [Pontibacillus yanchengensis]|uniref:Zn-dependent protease n=2 Tax=Pontibacillus yanchengensis TaxID=462910 RepID=A0A6I4ZYC6_9BACI|nr:zinc metallopeptidase [Pontibacillus yanchengensis]MYL32763.1 Zn-dependent protease [Pontibacillus yanchengensis]MYL55157.1 Zn-dependent protease [Pontibacillus yanchengensis]